MGYSEAPWTGNFYFFAKGSRNSLQAKILK
jgi:hypothetical protein